MPRQQPLAVFLMLLIMCIIMMPGVPKGAYTASENAVIIRVAIYDSVFEEYTEEAQQPLNYSWDVEEQMYRFVTIKINRGDILGSTGASFTTTSFDVFMVPGSGRPYIDALSPRWRTAVRSFVDMGGGYIGICGGANLASMGFHETEGLNRILDKSVLQMANVYVNNQQGEEWMYLWKANWQYGLPPITIYIPPSNNPVLKELHDETRSIRYGGGPGMYKAQVPDEKCGEIIPLAIYDEEPMMVAPIHYWVWREATGWAIYANVTTDIIDQYAAIATSYGQGRLFLVGPHPEKKTFFGGHIEEFPVRPNMGRLTWFIYNWSDGTLSPEEYNWGMLRRATAWVSQKVPDSHLPPLR